MRAPLAMALLLVVACTGTTAHPSARTSPSASTLASPSPSNVSSGGIIEYRLPTPIPNGAGCFGCGQSSLGGIAAGADGNLWFVDAGRGKVGRTTLSGTITEFDLPAVVGGPYGITAGPDGNIWVTTNALGQGRQDWILRMSADGAVSRFQAGTGTGNSGTGPQDITSGPDGNLWFTEFWSNRIGRMTPAGALTEFPIPTADSGPRGIVTGPDGNVWFVESSFNDTAIARITTAGDVTEYPLGGSAIDQLQPNEIVAGPDGNLWFSQGHPSAPQGEVGRITPNGAVTMIPFPAGGRPYGLAVGPDGNVWVTDPGGNSIARMSPAGAFRQFALPTRTSGPLGITAGKDGRMWFTEGGRIGSIGVTVPEAKLSARILNFGSGAGAVTHTVTVTNPGDAPLTVTSAHIAGPDLADFAIAGDSCSARSVAVNDTCRIEVTSKVGSDAGLRAARLEITDNGTASPQSVSLVAQVPDCRLPLFTSTSSSSKGEFLSLSDGQIVDDPNGGFVTAGALLRSQAEPVLSGTPPVVYDRAAGRWVPGVVAPDGTRYAYVDYGQSLGAGSVHVVDVATGRDRALNLPRNAWSVLAFTAAGIYLRKSYGEGMGPGLWVVDPDSGFLRSLFTDSTVMAVSGQTAWIGATNTSDPLPQPPGIGGGYNELRSIDLNTSKSTTWFYRSGTNLNVIAAAGGSLLVSGFDIAGSYLWAVGAPGKSDLITDPATGDPFSYAIASAAAPGSWWLGTAGGIYLWTARTGAVLLADADASPAGACA